MFIALLSAYHLLLERWSGQPDMIIGTGVAGRIRTELEPLIGFFVNTLLLRNEHADDLTVQELLHQTRETALSAYAHQDIPFAAVNEALNAEAAARGGTLSHSYFMLQNLSLPADAFTSLAVDSQHVRGPDPLTTLDLEFEIVQRRDHLACQFVYATDIYDSSTIAGLAVAFEDIAKGIASSPHVRANNLPWRGV
jgi:non-ribosomal peptide synthetase component F